MECSLYLPPAAETSEVPLVVFLSGLTCTWENVTTKGGFQAWAAQLGVAVLCPDTSPRGESVADDPSYDLGQGAGFYVNATEPPWAPHFRMDDYVFELLELVTAQYPVMKTSVGVTGHSMGGHGALVLGLRNPDRFRSISAFSPIVAPSQVPWGRKAFTAYLGPSEDRWAAYDACSLVTHARHPGSILIDQGRADVFFEEQLQSHRFENAAKASGQAATVRIHDGYDHSYYFVATFMEDHLRHHAAALGGKP